MPHLSAASTPVDQPEQDDAREQPPHQLLSERARARCRTAATVAGLVGAGLGLLALVGWTTGALVLAGNFGPSYNPMATSTAVMLILAGLGLCVHVQRQSTRPARVIALLIGLGLTLWGLFDLAQEVGHVRWDLETLLFRTAAQASESINSMSPFTGTLCLLFGIAFFLRVWSCGRAVQLAASILATVILVLSFWVLLGYIDGRWDALALYDVLGMDVQVALNTALAWLVLSAGLISAGGADDLVLCPFMGPSTRALLLRAFLPVTVVAVLIATALDHLFEQLSNTFKLALNDVALVSTLWIVISAMVVALIITYIARRLGNEIDQAEAARNKALEDMRAALAARAASEARLRAIMGTVADGIVTVTENGNIDSFNAAATRIFGYEPAEVLGQGISSLLVFPGGDGSEREILSQFACARAAGFGSAWEVVGRRKDGQTVPLELAVGAVQFGNLCLYTVSFHDLSNRKRAEEDLRRARDEAEEADRVKSQFLASMSHELRTPLTAILGYAEILQEELQERNQTDLLPDLQHIHGQGKHLLALINDLLDMSKIEAGKLQLIVETFNLAELIEDVAATIRPLAEPNGNRLVLSGVGPELGLMSADSTRLRQCLLNVLSNAAKFTTRGEISLTVTRRSLQGQDWVSFKVVDTGIGMTEEQVHKLFQPFVQIDRSTTRKFEGNGLGLAITRRLCRMMGGDIGVDSTINEGSTFTITLPAVARKSGAMTGTLIPSKPTAVMEPLPEPDQNTVLVVDDDPAVLDMMTRYLGREGFKVVTSTQGDECLRLARRLRPRAITLDVIMPGMDGWRVLQALKADPELADIPVIILTIVEDRQMGHALGAADYLQKPLDRDRLIEVLNRCCCKPPSRLALIAEDELSTRELLRRTLERDGWTVLEAVNGRAALDVIVKQHPALLLLDLMMPNMDGFELLTELREHPEWRPPAVVVITGKDLSEEERMFLSGSFLLGGSVRRVLQKGKFSLDELLTSVRDMVSSVN
jgi:PAS domain S-box-containing protein